jgi:hypothetical protein
MTVATHKVIRLVLHSTLHAPSWLSKYRELQQAYMQVLNVQCCPQHSPFQCRSRQEVLPLSNSFLTMQRQTYL